MGSRLGVVFVIFLCSVACGTSHRFDGGADARVSSDSDGGTDASPHDAGLDAALGPAIGTVRVHVTENRVPVAEALVWSSRETVRTDAEGNATVEIDADDFLSVRVDVEVEFDNDRRWVRTFTGVEPDDVLAVEVGTAGPLRPTTTLLLDLVVPPAPPGNPPDVPYVLAFCGGTREVNTTPGHVEVSIDPDCDVSAGVELVLWDEFELAHSFHGRSSVPVAGAVAWDPGTAWVAPSPTITVTFAPIADQHAYVHAVPLASADSPVRYFAFGVSGSGTSWSSPLPAWATHADLAAREFFVDGRMTQIMRRSEPIGPSAVLDRAVIPRSPTAGRATVSPEGVLTASWPALDDRADLVVLALQMEGTVPTTGEVVDLNWQVIAPPSSEGIGPLPLGAATWLLAPSIGLAHLIVIAQEEWENYADARANTHSAQWYLDHGAGAWSLARVDASLE